MGKFIDLTGKRFGRLTVTDRANNDGKHVQWNCYCDCGESSTARAFSLKDGSIKSCGCLQKERVKEAGKANKTHGMTESSEYSSWLGMISRCNNPNNNKYKLYGARGITVCDEWMKFENFYADMGARHNGMTLDRIDPNKGYFKENCRWATQQQQQRNRRNNRNLSIDGVTKTIAEWSELTGIKCETIAYRIKSGWSAKEVLTSTLWKRTKLTKPTSEQLSK